MDWTRDLSLALLLVLSCIVALQASKLNVPRVLLPYDHDGPANYTLKVLDGGCYRWTNSREDTVLLDEVEEDGCVSEVFVSAVSKSQSRRTAIILAQDVSSSSTLRCDVIVDAIHRLEIVTTTRELYVEEAPEEFEVRAYDDQGNEFTTMEGIEFEWDLHTITDRDSVVAAQTVLKFMSFHDSPYETPPAVSAIEEKGKQSYMVLIEGKQTGTARLSVRLAHPAYKDLPPTSVDLMVIANLLLDPAEVYVLAHTSLNYTVYQLKQGHLHTIDLGASQFYLEVQDPETAILNDDGISITALQLGNTQVILKDNNVKSSELVKNPTANVHVVEPSYLTISIAPHNNPVLITGRHYAILVHIYDKNNNKIFLADNIVVETTISTDYFTSEFVSENGTYVYGVPIKVGQTKVHATLSAIKVGVDILELSPPLRAVQDLDIYDPLQVLPPLTVLPWDPITTPTYLVNLTAIGGSGSVGWSSQNTNVAGVSQSGQCRTKTRGTVSISAAMTLNTNIKASGDIYILQALGLELLECVVEAEVDAVLPLPVVAFTNLENKPEVPFTLCHKLSFMVEPAETIFSALPIIKSPDVDGSCARVEVVGKTPGFSKVTVSYKTPQDLLTASTVVGAFRPLRVTQPASAETVLVVGTSRVVVFEGGPLPWISKPKSHFAQAIVDDPSKVHVELLTLATATKRKTADLHAVLVECKDLGEFKVTLTVGNKASTSLPHPKSVSSSVTVICGVPDSLSLNAVIHPPVGAPQACPTLAHNHMVVAHCYKPLKMEVIIRDSEGRKFDNVSSLALSWSVSNTALASIPAAENSVIPIEVAEYKGVQVPLMSYQYLEPVGEVGEIEVNVKVLGYITEVSEELGLALAALSGTLPLRLVKDASLNPLSAVLYRHQENSLDLTVSGGSGFFSLTKIESDIATLTYLPSDSTVRLQPLADGEVKVTLVDLCLDAVSPAMSVVRVASVVSLDMVMVERVELGGSLLAEVVAKDAAGLPLPAHALMNLAPHPQANIISAVYEDVNDAGNALYKVTGQHVGDTTLRVSAGDGESLVYSPSKPVQVFPPLTLQPKNITLLVGAVYQVETKGGPYPDAVVEYIMGNDTIAVSSHTGVVTARSLGVTKLSAQAVTVEKESGRTVVCSEDTVIIYVVPLETIRIHAPLTHLETGTSMPLYAIGTDEHQNPLSYATAYPPLIFEWSINDKQVASLGSVFGRNGLKETKENNGMVQLSASSAGRVTVSMKVKPSIPGSLTDMQILKNMHLTDILEIKVFESLRLKNPSDDGTQPLLLMSPKSEIQISSNRDEVGKVSFTLQDCSGSQVVSVSPSGVVRAGSNLGQATVIVSVQEDFGVVQSLSVLVEVKKIIYMQATVSEFMSVKQGETLSIVPLGAPIDLLLSYHDDRGRSFHATNTDPSFSPSRFDLLGVGQDNDTLHVGVRTEGHTILHLWDSKNTGIDHYVAIRSAAAVLPHKVSIPLGGHACFTSPVLGSEGSPGTWAVGDNNLAIDAESGAAVAQQIGRSTVIYDTTFSTIAEVAVTPIIQIKVSKPSGVMSNSAEGASLFAPVTLLGEGDSSSLCNPEAVPTSSSPFTCLLTFSPPQPTLELRDLLEVTPQYLGGKGYGCMISSKVGPTVSLATLQASLQLEAVVVSRGPQGEVRSGQLVVPFLPAPISEVTEILLTNEEPSALVTLQGIPAVLGNLKVTANPSSLLDVTIGAPDGDKVLITVWGRDVLWSPDLSNEEPITVVVDALEAAAAVTLTVNTVLVGDGTCAIPRQGLGFLSLVWTIVQHYQSFLFSALCLILTIICLLIGYRALFGPGYRQTSQSGVFNNSPAPRPPVSPAPVRSSSSPGDPVVTRLNYMSHASPVSTHAPTLWSVNTEPIYGAPAYPRAGAAYQGSPTYRTAHN
ncbi:unnamed protein product [Meganyctiphanes norvegica]|uniref:Nuclear pore membrane glycoprotein 210 n=1 Tax=Meganyctiphanes norvegica TaxID=48144 RepID=A0AAV2QR27_MEGNR